MTGSMTGKTLGNRYVIEDRVGLGGMAEVYRATDNVLGRPVAVKVMLPQYAEDETFTKRFRQEAASAANLQSPYIVNIYDWGQDTGGQYYIVMEFVRGADLKTGITQRGAINQRKVAEIGSQICQALSVAHNQDIIHRDIKPQNIMVQPDGNIKVMDFGIARAKNAGLTQTSSVLGTAHYISPEQAQGKELGPSSDIYSLGVVMYEAATGQLPFDGPDAVSVAMKQVSEQPVPPRAINPEIDPTLEAIILKAMAKNPADRFTNALEMRRALNDFLAGRPVNGLNTNAFANANTQFIGAAGLGNQAGATQIMPNVDTPITNNATRNVVYKTPTEEPERKSNTGKIIAIVVAIVAVIALGAAVAMFILGGSGNVSVPDVTNRTLEEATTLITDQKLKVGDVTRTSSNTVPEGKVISQDPKAGTHTEEGTKINLTISSGPEQVTVPDLTGMTAAEAKSTLTKLGLTAEAGKPVYSSEVEENKIVSQSPAANEKVASGSTVQYCLSLGKEEITVPSVINTAQESAVSKLEDLGFVVEVKTGESDSVSSGYVYKQEPSSGKLESGQTVVIYVSTGGSKINIPNVVGMNLSAALSAMQSAGFNCSVDGPQDSSAVVISQSDYGTGTSGQSIWLTTESGSTPTPSPGNTNTNTNNEIGFGGGH